MQATTPMSAPIAALSILRYGLDVEISVTTLEGIAKALVAGCRRQLSAASFKLGLVSAFGKSGRRLFQGLRLARYTRTETQAFLTVSVSHFTRLPTIFSRVRPTL